MHFYFKFQTVFLPEFEKGRVEVLTKAGASMETQKRAAK
jgi:hypothetical protein